MSPIIEDKSERKSHHGDINTFGEQSGGSEIIALRRCLSAVVFTTFEGSGTADEDMCLE